MRVQTILHFNPNDTGARNIYVTVKVFEDCFDQSNNHYS